MNMNQEELQAALEDYRRTGALPEDTTLQDAIMQADLGGDDGPADTITTPQDADQHRDDGMGGDGQPGVDQQAALDRRLDELNRLWEARFIEQQRTFLDAIMSRLPQSSQEKPEQPPDPAPEQNSSIQDIIDSLRSAADEGFAPELGGAADLFALMADENKKNAERLAELERHYQKQAEQERLTREAQIQQAQQARQDAINANPAMSYWQKDSASQAVLESLWAASAQSLANLTPVQQIEKIAAMAANILPPPPTTAASPPKTPQTVVQMRQQSAPQPRHAPPLYSVGDVPGQAPDSREQKLATEMSDTELDKILANMDDKQFSAFVSGRRF